MNKKIIGILLAATFLISGCGDKTSINIRGSSIDVTQEVKETLKENPYKIRDKVINQLAQLTEEEKQQALSQMPKTEDGKTFPEVFGMDEEEYKQALLRDAGMKKLLNSIEVDVSVIDLTEKPIYTAIKLIGNKEDIVKFTETGELGESITQEYIEIKPGEELPVNHDKFEQVLNDGNNVYYSYIKVEDDYENRIINDKKFQKLDEEIVQAINAM